MNCVTKMTVIANGAKNLMIKYIIFLNPMLTVPPLVNSSMKSAFFIFQPRNTTVSKPPMVIRKVDVNSSRASNTRYPKIVSEVSECKL